MSKREPAPRNHSSIARSDAPRRDVDADMDPEREGAAHQGLTTDQGIPIAQTDDSLKAGVRGPTTLDDFHLREKLTRFDHERIPERVVHARGSGAHGFFKVYESLADLTSADFLQDPQAVTPVFVRFSTVVGSRGSSDLARDVRGFATRFYTQEGNFDLVGNNMPVFFIQDGMKFPDLVHAVKPEPHHEMPQAASAHDTFWDFVSLMPETMHMVLWVMSDRGLPRSYRMMEGFGVHTFRLINSAGRSVLVKFHWKPVLGAHSLVWDEAQKISGQDPDFHRRDLWDAIASGNYPEYELGLQVMQEEDELRFGFDLLDPTKLVPEELVPVRRVGRLTLNRNPDNFFAETEQVAYCVGNVVPGIGFSNDPLLQARLFSYLDTQLLRLGGPNFTQLPINRPLGGVRNHQQDGPHQHDLPTSRALYHPNTIAGNRPRPADPRDGYQHPPEPVSGTKIRARSDSFLDHFTQARMFLASQSPAEYSHLVAACQFELAKVERLAIRERVVMLFHEVDAKFGEEVAAAAGVSRSRLGKPAADARKPMGSPAKKVAKSPALSLDQQPRDTIATRKVAILVAAGVRAADIDQVRGALQAAGAVVETVGPILGPVRSAEGRPIDVVKTLATASSVLYDATFVPGGASVETLLERIESVRWLAEAYAHGKALAASNEGITLFERAQLPGTQRQGRSGKPGPVPGVTLGSGEQLGAFAAAFVDAIRQHRHFGRDTGNLRD
jgi:catalase